MLNYIVQCKNALLEESHVKLIDKISTLDQKTGFNFRAGEVCQRQHDIILESKTSHFKDVFWTCSKQTKIVCYAADTSQAFTTEMALHVFDRSKSTATLLKKNFNVVMFKKIKIYRNKIFPYVYQLSHDVLSVLWQK